MVAEIAALDFWTLFVSYVFGNFWLAVIGLGILFFAIMGPVGRLNPITITWFNVLFLLSMCLGGAYLFVTVIINLLILVYFYFSVKGAVDVR